MEHAKIEQSNQDYRALGYSEELLPKGPQERDWGIFNYITVWMGAVHNIMSYMTVAGFFVLGLSVNQVFLAIMLSAVIVSAGYCLNGYSASKYGIPFAILLRDSFGVKGSIIPALCRGLVRRPLWALNPLMYYLQDSFRTICLLVETSLFLA